MLVLVVVKARQIWFVEIRAGLEASTVTPGITAPVVSCTAPAMLPWANVDDAVNISRARTWQPVH